MKTDVKSLVSELNKMIQNGQALEAFEKFYDESVVMQENETPPRIGKALNRDFEKAFVKDVSAWTKANVKNLAVGDDVSMVEWELEFTHNQWGKVARSQISVQQWRNGKIISEKFYYGA